MRKWSKLLSALLAVSLLLSLLPVGIPFVSAAEDGGITVTGSADPSTVIGSLDSDALAGGFYADKSVTYDAANQSFTATLSALTKDYQTNVNAEDLVPMDVIVIVDVSASMSEMVITPDTTDWTRVDYLSWGMNTLIDTVIEGTNNRLGVVTFSGNAEVGTSSNNASILIPLDHYDKVDFSVSDTTFTLSSGTVRDTKQLDVSYKATGSSITYTDYKKMMGGTFTQTGLAKAYEMMSANTDRTETIGGQEVYRTPVVVLITDGQPTWATATYYKSITSSTTSEYGNGSTDVSDYGSSDTATEDQALLDYIAYCTIFSGKYYSDLMAGLYTADGTANPNYRFMSVGIGVDVLPNASPAFAQAFLDPSVENVDALANDSDYYTNNNVVGASGSVVNLSAKLKDYLTDDTTGVYDGSKDYATDSYMIDNANTGYALAEVFADIAAISVSTSQTDYFGPLEAGTMVTFTDTVGDGMYVSSAPVLNYGGVEYYGSRSESGSTVTYSYSGTVKPLNASDYADYTVSLAGSSVTISTDTNGRQTLTWTLPAELVPSYSYDTTSKSYVAAEPVKLYYDIAPTAQTLANLPTGTTTLYTNNYTDAPTTVEYNLSTESAYYAQTFADSATVSTVKSSNITGTNTKVSTITAGDTHDVTLTDSNNSSVTITCAEMNATLGNNGKLVLTKTDSTQKDGNGSADPSTVPTGITQSTTPGTVLVDKSIGYDASTEEFNATLTALSKDYYEIVDSSVEIPMDVVIVLDISYSMNALTGSSTTSRRMNQVATQINNLCSSLISENAENRIGIITYSGAATTAGPTESNASTLLSLDSYTSVQLSYSFDSTNDVGTLTAYRNGSSYTGNTVSVSGGTYTQTGIAAAYKMLSDETSRTYTASNGKTYDRTPAIILVTDGQPTWATTDYSNSVIGTSTIGNGTVGISTDGTVSDVSMDEIAYYTILSGQHFAGQMKALYNGNPNARFITIGVGMDDMDATEEAVDTIFVNTILNPTMENIERLSASSSLQNYASDLQALLTSAATLYNGTSYADEAFNVSDDNITSISGVVLNALTKVETQTIHRSALAEGTNLVFTDTIGNGMEITSAPVLTYGGAEYQPSISGSTYTYSGTVYPDASLTPVSLSGMRVTVTTNASGAQVLTWTIPAALVPSYIYDAESGEYLSASPAYLNYHIAPTAEMRDSGQVLYTNNYTSAPTTAVFTPDASSPLVTTGNINDIPAVIKGENTTETNPNVNTTEYDSTSGEVTVTLGNNGKWVNDVAQTMDIHVNTLWYTPEGTLISNSAETTSVTLYRYALDENGDMISGSSAMVEAQSFGSGTWSGTFSDLPMTDANGNTYAYWVSQTITSESGVSYTTTYQVNEDTEKTYCADVTEDGSTVTIHNRQTETGTTETMDIHVNTLWYDEAGQRIENSDETTTNTLIRYSTDGNGNLTGEPIIVDTQSFGSGTWSGTFSDLPKEDENGNGYVYQVQQTITSASGVSYTTTYQVNAGAEESTCGNVTEDESTVTIYNRQPIAGLTVEKQWVDPDGTPVVSTSGLPEITAQLIQVDTATTTGTTDPEPEPDPEPAEQYTVTFSFYHNYKEGYTEKASYDPNSYSITVSAGSSAVLSIVNATGLEVSETSPVITVSSDPTANVTHTLATTHYEETYNDYITLTGGVTVSNVSQNINVKVLLTGVWSSSLFSSFEVTTSEVPASRSTRAPGETHTVSFLINGQSTSVNEISGLSGASSTASFSVSGVEDGKTLTLTLTDASGLKMWCLDAQPVITVSSTGSATVTNTLAYTLDTTESSSSPLLSLTGSITIENITEDITVTVLIVETYISSSKFTSFTYETAITGESSGGGSEGGEEGGNESTEPTVTESVYTTLTLNEANGWSVNLTDLPVSSVDGDTSHSYTYYVVETDGDAYGVSYSNNDGITTGTITLTNRAPAGSVPDTVVVDFGLPIDVHVLVNDRFGTKGSLMGIGPVPESMTATDSLLSGFGESYTGLFGSAAYSGDTVTYTPSNMRMSDTEVFAYAVKYTDGNTVLYFYDTVTVVPATTIYYEDDFVAFTGNWETVGETQTDHQGEDRPGDFEFPTYDADNIYGYDPAYDTCTTYSFGSAQKVTVSGSTYTENGAWPTASFVFTGTGFDLISLTSNQTGFITCRVYEGTQTNTIFRSWVVDTYYGYERSIDDEFPWVKYTWTYNGAEERWSAVKEAVAERGDDETAELPTNPSDGDVYVQYKENYNWEPTDGDNDLYQIPVIKSPALDYGTYTVVVTPTYIPFFDHLGTGSYDFYMDAVRIYSPAQGLDEEYYVQDNEGWPQYIELRQEILSRDESGNATAYVNGISFIDGVSNGDGNDSISDYESFGPNNEIYLESRQAVAFAIESNGENIAAVHVGVKTFATTGTLEISTVDPEGSTLYTGTLSTGSHTDLYYDLTKAYIGQESGTVSNVIVLTNTGETPVTLTTLKITYASQPTTDAALCMNLELMEAAGNLVTQRLATLNAVCYHNDTYTVTTAPTQESKGLLTCTCADCGRTETVEMPSLSEYEYPREETKAPTCTEAGELTYTYETYNVSFTAHIPALGHDLITDEAVPATCTENGLTEGCHCSRCDYAEAQETVTALGHDLITDESVPATCTENGLTEGCHCSRCDYAEAQETVTALGHDYAEGVCALCGEKDPDWQEPIAECPSKSYTDVPEEGHWAHEGIDFVLAEGIMNGVGENLFAPDDTMTRAMLVTVLWRMEGEPEAESENSFTDVPSDSWYAQAVAWAQKENIVNGVGEGLFDPMGQVTREQMATILYRYGQQKGLVEESSELTAFADSDKVSPWAQEAMSWAVAAEIMKGAAEQNGVLLLMPTNEITRAQAAAMLMRYCGTMEESE